MPFGNSPIMPPLVFLALCAVIMVMAGFRYTAKTNLKVLSALRTSPQVPKAIGLLIMTAQATELVRMIEHTTIVNIVAVIFVSIILLAIKKGSEEERYGG